MEGLKTISPGEMSQTPKDKWRLFSHEALKIIEFKEAEREIMAVSKAGAGRKRR